MKKIWIFDFRIFSWLFCLVLVWGSPIFGLDLLLEQPKMTEKIGWSHQNSVQKPEKTRKPKIYNFFHTTFCMKKPCFKAFIRTPIGLRALNLQNFLLNPKSLAVALWSTFALDCSQLPMDPGFPGKFRNVANFEELYLRAQWIFFDGTGTVAKIYV